MFGALEALIRIHKPNYFTENCAHVRTVCTRPYFRPGNDSCRSSVPFYDNHTHACPLTRWTASQITNLVLYGNIKCTKPPFACATVPAHTIHTRQYIYTFRRYDSVPGTNHVWYSWGRQKTPWHSPYGVRHQQVCWWPPIGQKLMNTTDHPWGPICLKTV